MRVKRAPRLARTGLLLILAAAISACAPQLYRRNTVVLDHAALDLFRIGYAEFDGCLLRREVPVNYELQRPHYRMRLEIHFGNGGNAAGIGLELSGPDALSARFADLDPAPVEQPIDGGVRYRIDSASVRADRFTIQVLGDGVLLGEETLQTRTDSCHAVSLGRVP